MIKSVGDKRTRSFWEGKRVKEFTSFERQAQKRLNYLNEATSLDDLAQLPSNRLHPLTGDLKGFYSISINQQYRVIFQWDKESGDAYNVRITDYH